MVKMCATVDSNTEHDNGFLACARQEAIPPLPLNPPNPPIMLHPSLGEATVNLRNCARATGGHAISLIVGHGVAGELFVGSETRGPRIHGTKLRLITRIRGTVTWLCWHPIF
jgi:hypothetical protein